MTARAYQTTGTTMYYDVRYLESGSPRKVRVAAADAAAVVSTAASAVAGVIDVRAPRFELLSVVPTAVRFGGG